MPPLAHTLRVQRSGWGLPDKSQTFCVKVKVSTWAPAQHGADSGDSSISPKGQRSHPGPAGQWPSCRVARTMGGWGSAAMGIMGPGTWGCRPQHEDAEGQRCPFRPRDPWLRVQLSLVWELRVFAGIRRIGHVGAHNLRCT